MQTLKIIGAKLFIRRPENYIFWITLALLVKGVFFIFRIHHDAVNSIPGFIGEVWGDTNDYLDPIDNLLKTGVYNSIGVYNQLDRMPGYGAPYFLFRLLFAKDLACNMLIILQVIADAISVYALALIARKSFKSNTLFYLTFYFYLVNTYTSLYDNILLTESLTTSTLIFSLYFLIVYTQNYRLKNLLFSGFFLMWAIFLRQVYFPVILFVGLFLIFYLYRENKKSMLNALICFTIPFILAEGYWIARNYRIEKKFIPFIKSHDYDPNYNNYTNYRFALSNFVKSWGGDIVQWYPKAEVRWFWPRTIKGGKEIKEKGGITLPNDIYTSKFTIDSLKRLRSYIAVIEYTDTPQSIKNLYNSLLINEFNTYSLSEKQEHPYIYYIRAPLTITYNILLNPRIFDLSYRSYNTHNYELYLIKKAFRGFLSFTYIWVIVFGILGAVFYCKDWFRFNVKGLLSVIVLYSISVYPLIFRLTENRYLVPAYPFLLLFASCFSLTLFIKFSNKGKVNTKTV